MRIKRLFKKSSFLQKIATLIILRIAKWQHSPFFLLRWIGSVLNLPLYILFRDNYYKFLIVAQKIETLPSSKVTLPLLPKLFFIRALTGDKAASPITYAKYLSQSNFSADVQFEWARRFMEVGRLDLSRVGFQHLLEQKTKPLASERRLHALRQLGAVCFMLGKNKEANHYWRLAGQFRRSLFKPSTPIAYRILGSAWIAAIGHVAMLDYYIKFKQLYNNQHRIVLVWDMSSYIPGAEILEKLTQFGIAILPMDTLESDYNEWATKNKAPAWERLSSDERAALVDDFWEYDFPNGDILGYAHAAARIQQEWEATQRSSLFILSESEKVWLQNYLLNLGLPRDAWYVCLHVRESGFHKQWNSFYPTMRDADIQDYNEAIKAITDKGGWVIRMGDVSMKPLPAMPNVIDYAHSFFKSSLADLLIVAGCRFYLGTNSGFATLGVIYGIPCALTNWVPLGWPLWPSQDLMIPKLFRNKNTGHYLNLKDIFKYDLAFIQNWSDLPSHIELIENTSEDINALALEMLHRLQAEPFLASKKSVLAQNYYKQLAITYEGFCGSHLGAAFVEKHSEVFIDLNVVSTETIQGNQTCHGQSNTNMTAILN